MNYMIVLANVSTFRSWQFLFGQNGSRDFVKRYARGLIMTEKLLSNYEGDIQLWKCDEIDERIAQELICTFNLKHQRSITGGE